MRDSWYDTATICANGHIINPVATSYPEITSAYCDRCGAPVLDRCLECGAPIRGEFHLSGMLNVTPYTPPAYCHSCGYPYPWTQARIEAAQALVDELVVLTGIERELLKESIEEIVGDGPRAPAAILRFKRLVGKAGGGMAKAFREILVDVVSEAVKKAIWG